ncbi:MAG: twin-arginine translocase TatA/TatE family subunit [bacterium]|nr:twin-arginine translocase TatA/TatE family subunit [bacterium]MXZ30812.1 twin-arginine translocase TatA/TatE family subunit [Acidimicrobiia bacterium]MYB25761.1 twin-arginine translocase TatA/TatE family subunit [Acidimicrobiia bacterium]MYE68024.1 twin-arginine translocase TatA/TatE family subunit [Acidimicrobiia bacterium]MYJ14718.1 twin-arginine translocase TatA/TatE family subunit [Acidimicrobiia bacterium]
MAVIGTTELIVILVIVLVIFGGAKLPKLARSLGQAQREFRKNAGELEEPASGESAESKNTSDA